MLIVQKYGGTSVGSLERIKNVARRIAKFKDEGHDLVVTVSAMAGETNRLVDLVYGLSDDPNPREYDQVVSTGEQVSIGLVAIALQEMGYDAISLTGWQVGMKTDSAHMKARILNIDTARIKKYLDEGKIVIVAGFQGIDENGNITTLGRGGSDTTAVALAAALSADLCEIYTDVDGVYTADPRIVPKARKLDKISYEEMLEMASLGAKVLQIRSVEFAMKYNVPLVVRSSLNFNPGTIITKEDKEMEKVLVSGVTYNKNEAKISVRRVPDKPGIAAKIFDPLKDANINVDMIIQNISKNGYTDLSFTVARNEMKKAVEIVKKVAEEIGAEGVEFDDTVAKVSIVGVGMRSHPGVAATMFDTLAENNINIQMISTSEIKISCVIDEKYTELAVRVLHDAFNLEKEPEPGE